MKKIISSALVFALMGIPVASGAFADKATHEEAVSKIITLIEESNRNGDTETAKIYEEALDKLLKVSYNQKEEILDEFSTEDSKESDDIDEDLFRSQIQIDPEVDEDLLRSQIQIDSEVDEDLLRSQIQIGSKDDTDKDSTEIHEENREKTETDIVNDEESKILKVREILEKEMSTTKKVLITAGAIATVAVAGYVAYTYYPAVQDFINDQASNLGEVAETAKDFVVEKAGAAKDFMEIATASAKDFIVENAETAKDFAEKVIASAKNFVVDKAEVTKDFMDCDVIPYLGYLKNQVATYGSKVVDFSSENVITPVKSALTSSVNTAVEFTKTNVINPVKDIVDCDVVPYLGYLKNQAAKILDFTNINVILPAKKAIISSSNTALDSIKNHIISPVSSVFNSITGWFKS